MNRECRSAADIDSAEARKLFILSVKRLMLAVLEDAMQCYQAYAGGRSRLRAEAEAWLLDRHAEGPFAFETICQTLKIDPDCLRRGLSQWRVRQLNDAMQRSLARRLPLEHAGVMDAPVRWRRGAATAPDTATARLSIPIEAPARAAGSGVGLK